MKKQLLQLAVVLLGLMAFFAAIGIAGCYEFADEVVYEMDDSTFDAVSGKIGTSDARAVAKEYLANKEFYDRNR